MTIKTPPLANKKPFTCGRILTICCMLTLLGLTACAQKTINTHGHVINENRLGAIQLGVTTKEGVRRLLGTPPLTSSFADNEWIYITETAESRIFGESETTDRKIYLITFDADNRVSRVSERNKEDGRNITFSQKVTPTSGQSMGVIDQMLDNIGVQP